MKFGVKYAPRRGDAFAIVPVAIIRSGEAEALAREADGFGIAGGLSRVQAGRQARETGAQPVGQQGVSGPGPRSAVRLEFGFGRSGGAGAATEEAGRREDLRERPEQRRRGEEARRRRHQEEGSAAGG